jgi:hypothetical protein
MSPSYHVRGVHRVREWCGDLAGRVRRRLKELVLYIAERTVEDPDFGRTKVAEMLFCSDVEAYRLFGEPITGARYEKWKRVPFPVHLRAAGRLLVLTAAMGISP